MTSAVTPVKWCGPLSGGGFFGIWSISSSAGHTMCTFCQLVVKSAESRRRSLGDWPYAARNERLKCDLLTKPQRSAMSKIDSPDERAIDEVAAGALEPARADRLPDALPLVLEEPVQVAAGDEVLAGDRRGSEVRVPRWASMWSLICARRTSELRSGPAAATSRWASTARDEVQQPLGEMTAGVLRHRCRLQPAQQAHQVLTDDRADARLARRWRAPCGCAPGRCAGAAARPAGGPSGTRNPSGRRSRTAPTTATR